MTRDASKDWVPARHLPLLGLILLLHLSGSSLQEEGVGSPGVDSSEFSISSSASGSFSLLTTLRKSTPAAGDLFGWSLGAYRDQVVVGAPYHDAGAQDAGATYVYDIAGRRLLQTFPNPTPNSDDNFGSSLSVVGDNIVVGVPYDDDGANNAGVAYLFSSKNAIPLKTIRNPMPGAGDLLGHSVLALGSRVLVGAPFDDSKAGNAGAVYLFDTATGDLLRIFHSPVASTGEYFGWSLAAVGESILIGAPGNDLNSTAQDAGIAYLLDLGMGHLMQTFRKPVPAGGDYFGWSVAAIQENILVGAIGDDSGAINAGAVYLFDTAGNLVRSFENPTPADVDQFGLSITSLGGHVLVGAPYDDTVVRDGGAAYLFNGTTGELIQTFHSPQPMMGDYFGWSVTGFENVIAIGAPYDDASASAFDAGAVYVFTKPRWPASLFQFDWADYDNGGAVTIFDVARIAACYNIQRGASSSNCSFADSVYWDFDLDGIISIFDIGRIARQYPTAVASPYPGEGQAYGQLDWAWSLTCENLSEPVERNYCNTL